MSAPTAIVERHPARSECAAAILLVLAVAGSGAAAQSAEVWSRTTIPASPSEAPATLTLPTPWLRQMNEAMALTLTKGREHAGCLHYGVLPLDVERLDRAADALRGGDSASMRSALATLSEEGRAISIKGPLQGSLLEGTESSVDGVFCGTGAAQFHTHPSATGTPPEIGHMPSGTDMSHLLSVIGFSGVDLPITIIRSERSHFALIPTLRAVDVEGFARLIRQPHEDIITRRKRWVINHLVNANLEAGFKSATSLWQLRCPLRGEELLTCVTGMLARFFAEAGYAMYVGDAGGLITKVAADAAPRTGSSEVTNLQTIAANVITSPSWPPRIDQLLAEPAWKLSISDEFRQAHRMLVPWLARSGWIYTDRDLARVEHIGSGDFRGAVGMGWPGVGPISRLIADSSEDGHLLWLGVGMCILSNTDRPPSQVVMLAQHRIPKGATSLKDVQPEEAGRTAIVVSDGKRITGHAFLGKVAGGSPRFEGMLPVVDLPDSVFRWNGRFVLRFSPNRCTGAMPYIADGEGRGEIVDRLGHVKATFEGRASAGRFTGKLYHATGQFDKAFIDQKGLVP